MKPVIVLAVAAPLITTASFADVLKVHSIASAD